MNVALPIVLLFSISWQVVSPVSQVVAAVAIARGAALVVVGAAVGSDHANASSASSASAIRGSRGLRVDDCISVTLSCTRVNLKVCTSKPLALTPCPLSHFGRGGIVLVLCSGGKAAAAQHCVLPPP